MPTYTAKCSKCHKLTDFVCKVDDRNDTPKCCRKKTERILVAPQLSAMNFTGHKSFAMTDGTWIETGADYKRYMREHNKVSFSEGSQEAEHVSKERAKADDKKLTEAVTQAVIKHTS